MSVQNTAVFDFDGTIISTDTGLSFNAWLIKKSPVRLLLMLMYYPLFLLLTSNNTSKKLGLNGGCYIATALQMHNMFRLRKDFLDFLFDDQKARFYQDAISKIQWHQQQGHKIVILSGCPHWLLHKILQRSGLKNLHLIGSEIKLFRKGLILGKHCYSSNKLGMALSNHEDPRHWLFGYSDHFTDRYILMHCKQVYLINTSNAMTRKIQKFLARPVTVLNWS